MEVRKKVSKRKPMNIYRASLESAVNFNTSYKNTYRLNIYTQ